MDWRLGGVCTKRMVQPTTESEMARISPDENVKLTLRPLLRIKQTLENLFYEK